MNLPEPNWFKKKVYYPVYRFWDKYNPRQLAREAVYIKQRITRGWSDRDWWSMDYYLKDVIPAMLRKYAKDGNGYPGTHAYDTPEKWSAALLKAADDIEAWYIHDEKDFPSDKAEQEQYFEESKAAQDRTRRGMQFVADNFLSLWD